MLVNFLLELFWFSYVTALMCEIHSFYRVFFFFFSSSIWLDLTNKHRIQDCIASCRGQFCMAGNKS